MQELTKRQTILRAQAADRLVACDALSDALVKEVVSRVVLKACQRHSAKSHLSSVLLVCLQHNP